LTYPKAPGKLSNIFSVTKAPTEALLLKCNVKKLKNETSISMKLGNIYVLPSVYSFEGLFVCSNV
jgi:hypothetical protein